MLIFLFPPLSVTYLFLHSLWDRKGKRTDYLWCLFMGHRTKRISVGMLPEVLNPYK